MQEYVWDSSLSRTSMAPIGRLIQTEALDVRGI